MTKKEKIQRERGEYERERKKRLHNQKLWGIPPKTVHTKSETVQKAEDKPLVHKHMKNWYTSKTILLAVVQAVAGIILLIQTEFPEAGWALMAKSVIDIFLRFVSATPVARKIV